MIAPCLVTNPVSKEWVKSDRTGSLTFPSGVCMVYIGSHTCEHQHSCMHTHTSCMHTHTSSWNTLKYVLEMNWKNKLRIGNVDLFLSVKSGEWKPTAFSLPPLLWAGRLVKDQEDVRGKGLQTKQTEAAQTPVMECCSSFTWMKQWDCVEGRPQALRFLLSILANLLKLTH